MPLQPTGTPGEFVAGVRYRAWSPPSALHPTIGVHSPLVFDIVDTWSGARPSAAAPITCRIRAGATTSTFPVNANEAEARRVARFWDHGHTPGPMQVAPEAAQPPLPLHAGPARASPEPGRAPAPRAERPA